MTLGVGMERRMPVGNLFLGRCCNWAYRWWWEGGRGAPCQCLYVATVSCIQNILKCLQHWPCGPLATVNTVHPVITENRVGRGGVTSWNRMTNFWLASTRTMAKLLYISRGPFHLEISGSIGQLHREYTIFTHDKSTSLYPSSIHLTPHQTFQFNSTHAIHFQLPLLSLTISHWEMHSCYGGLTFFRINIEVEASFIWVGIEGLIIHYSCIERYNFRVLSQMGIRTSHEMELSGQKKTEIVILHSKGHKSCHSTFVNKT